MPCRDSARSARCWGAASGLFKPWGSPRLSQQTEGRGQKANWGSQGRVMGGYLSSRRVSPGSRLCSSSPQLQAAPGGGPAELCWINNPLLQPYPKLITERTRSNTRPLRALTPSPASPGRCFFPPCKERKERREKGLRSEPRAGPGELFPCPICAGIAQRSRCCSVPPARPSPSSHQAGGEGPLWRDRPSSHRRATTRDRGNLPTPRRCLGGQGCRAVREDTAHAAVASLFPMYPSRHSWKHFPGHIPALRESSAGYFRSRACVRPQDVPPPLP